MSDTWTERDLAENFVRGVEVGANQFGNYYHECNCNLNYGQPTGFVYFVGIGDPYITHVKIGFTSKHPSTRIKSLQTGCPFKIKMLGFVFGNPDLEHELHDVLRDDRAAGEWFAWTEHVEKIVKDQLESEAP